MSYIIAGTQTDFNVRLQITTAMQTDSCNMPSPPATPKQSCDPPALAWEFGAPPLTPVHRASFLDADEAEEMEYNIVGSFDSNYRPSSESTTSSCDTKSTGMIDTLVPTTRCEASEPTTTLGSGSNSFAGPAAQHCRKPKFIVFESRLQQLLPPTCTMCRMPWHKQLFVVGSMVTSLSTCSNCNNTAMWRSQPLIRQKPAGNILIAAGLLFSGCLVATALRWLRSINVEAISFRHFYIYQKLYLLLTINKARFHSFSYQ
ncbi:uncharacterized protein LOC142804229 [Rhipicephalus microplus]|uniref:uncharacterized protein LOC142804229 n=1 Tax=Rhipicephalus microplus TaxID=6941 RepID=UPI003F6B91B0